jgi:hypothetical protein
MVHLPLFRAGLALLSLAVSVRAQSSGDLDMSHSEMRPYVERYAVDRESLRRRHRVPLSPQRRDRMRRFFGEWEKTLDTLAFEAMGREGRIDWLLLRNQLGHELRRLQFEEARLKEMESLLPFRSTIVDLAETRRRMEPIDARKAADTLDTLRSSVDEIDRGVRKEEVACDSRSVANRALSGIGELRRALKGWYRYYAGYDPLFSWWAKAPYEQADRALETYDKTVRERLVKAKEDDLIGDPIGREALVGELEFEMIPYSPEELIEVAKSELRWCDAEMQKAAKELGFSTSMISLPCRSSAARFGAWR